MTSILSAPHFHDEEAAYAYVEARLWKKGRVCPHCGTVGNSVALKGKTTRVGVYKCRDCRKPFTVKIGTVFEGSNIKMHIWLQGIHLLASSKKGFSSNQFARTLGISLKAAWFMSQRLREAMREGALVPFGQMSGGVEVDETYFGQNTNKEKVGTPLRNMNQVLTLIDRDTGRARSMVMDEFTIASVTAVLQENVAKQAYLLTDQAPVYKQPGQAFMFHGTVNHSKKEYVSAEAPWVHTNTVESFFSVWKRGMRGTYQHCSREHLFRYCSEFDFRYSHRAALGVDDEQRAEILLEGVKGKRLKYRPASRARGESSLA